MDYSVIESLVGELTPSPISTNTTYSAVVSHVDNDGKVWVNLAGSNIETPTATTSSEVRVNDHVTVQWRNNRLYIEGNTSNPSAGVVRVGAVETTANNAQTTADLASLAADAAQETANAAGRTATKYITAVGDYGIKVHAEEAVDINYTKIDGEGMEVYKGTSLADTRSVAKFGDETRVGAENDSSITIDGSSIVGIGAGGKEFFTFAESTGELSTKFKNYIANKISYADFPHTSATGISAELQTTPTTGTPITVKVIYYTGNTMLSLPFADAEMEFTAGTTQTKSVTATNRSGTITYTLYATYNSNNDAFSNVYATVSPSSTDDSQTYIVVYAKYQTVATAPSYELGSGDAIGGYSFIEGFDTEARGNYSHAGGYSTKASGEIQTVFGKYNVEDTDDDFAFIIGNGTGDGGTYDRNNGFTVSWNGTVNISGNSSHSPTYRINGYPLSPEHIGEADYVMYEGTNGSWTYRRWKSGKREAWCGYSFTSSASAVWASPIRYWDKTINIPSGIFTTTPRIIATSQSTQYWIGGCSASSATSATARILTVATSNMELNLSIYAVTG